MLRALKNMASLSLLLCAPAMAQETASDNGFDEAAFKAALEAALPEARAFADGLQDAIADAESDAASLAESAQRYAVPSDDASTLKGINVDQILRNHQPAIKTAHSGQTSALPFPAFISLSMPEASLRPLLADVAKSGGVVLLRGFKDGSVKETAAALQALTDDGEILAGAAVDPRLFRSFEVTAVPTFIMPGGALGVCETPNCTEPAPPHDRIAGNVTVGYALRQLADHGDAAPEVARRALKQLEATPWNDT